MTILFPNLMVLKKVNGKIYHKFPKMQIFFGTIPYFLKIPEEFHFFPGPAASMPPVGNSIVFLSHAHPEPPLEHASRRIRDRCFAEMRGMSHFHHSDETAPFPAILQRKPGVLQRLKEKTLIRIQREGKKFSRTVFCHSFVFRNQLEESFPVPADRQHSASGDLLQVEIRSAVEEPVSRPQLFFRNHPD